MYQCFGIVIIRSNGSQLFCKVVRALTIFEKLIGKRLRKLSKFVSWRPGTLPNRDSTAVVFQQIFQNTSFIEYLSVTGSLPYQICRSSRQCYLKLHFTLSIQKYLTAITTTNVLKLWLQGGRGYLERNQTSSRKLFFENS